MPPFQPFNYGNVLSQGENILNSRAQRDPNSPNNRLREAQIQSLEMKAQNPAQINPTAEIKNYEFYQQLDPAGRAKFDHMLRGQRLIKSGGVWNIVAPDNSLIPVGTLAEETNAATQLKEAEAQGTANVNLEMGPRIEWEKMMARQQAEGGLGLGGGNVSRADIARQTEAAKIKGQAEGQSGLAGNIAIEETRLADNLGVIETIDELLGKDESGTTLLSYAYGTGNKILPDVVKSQFGWTDAEAMRDRVVGSLQLENVKKLKGTGPITENEQKILAQAASVLSNPLITPALAEREARRVRAMFAKWAADNQAAIDRGESLNTGQGDNSQGDDPLGLFQ